MGISGESGGVGTYGYHDGLTLTDSFYAIPPSLPPSVIAVDGLAVNITVCGQTFISDQDWVCTDTRPWTTSWRLGSYTPFQWMHAALVRDAATVRPPSPFSSFGPSHSRSSILLLCDLLTPSLPPFLPPFHSSSMVLPPSPSGPSPAVRPRVVSLSKLFAA